MVNIWINLRTPYLYQKCCRCGCVLLKFWATGSSNTWRMWIITRSSHIQLTPRQHWGTLRWTHASGVPTAVGWRASCKLNNVSGHGKSSGIDPAGASGMSQSIWLSTRSAASFSSAYKQRWNWPKRRVCKNLSCRLRETKTERSGVFLSGQNHHLNPLGFSPHLVPDFPCDLLADWSNYIWDQQVSAKCTVELICINHNNIYI